MATSRVLVIDDDPRLTHLLCDALAEAGFDVSAANNGDRGLSKFIADGHDVVVTDIIMPGREGLETLRAMKSHEPRVKVIAMSGGGLIGPQTFLELADHMGADATLAKPFLPGELIALVHQMMARKVDA